MKTDFILLDASLKESGQGGPVCYREIRLVVLRWLSRLDGLQSPMDAKFSIEHVGHKVGMLVQVK
jgi:hypothetical protein